MLWTCEIQGAQHRISVISCHPGGVLLEHSSGMYSYDEERCKTNVMLPLTSLSSFFNLSFSLASAFSINCKRKEWLRLLQIKFIRFLVLKWQYSPVNLTFDSEILVKSYGFTIQWNGSLVELLVFLGQNICSMKVLPHEYEPYIAFFFWKPASLAVGCFPEKP